jgi:putative hemolysin
MPYEKTEILQIDVKAVLAAKLGKRARYVPGFVVRALERAVCIDRFNALLRSNAGRRGADLARGVLRDLDVTVDVAAAVAPNPAQRRLLIVSNHPLGGPDGLALIAHFQEYFGGQVYFIVNDMLMAIEPLRDVFVPVNKVGAQSRTSVTAIDQVFASPHPVLIFPAGLVSRLGDDGSICDLEWKKMFVNKAIEYQRDILPVFVSGKNSMFFYRLARLRKRLGIKFNIEMVRLPRELFNLQHKTLHIVCGGVIPWQTLSGGADARATADKIKQTVYNLKTQK